LPDELLRPKQAAAVLRVTSKTLARYAQFRGLPYEETPGGHRRYWRSKLLEWDAAQADRREAMRATARARGQQTAATRNSQPGSSDPSTTRVPAGSTNGSGRAVRPPARPEP
jgi:hypothetical protein